MAEGGSLLVGSQDFSVAELAADVQRLKILSGSYAQAQYTETTEASFVGTPV